MFRRVPLSTIRSFSLYTMQWYTSYVIQDMLTTCEQAVSIKCVTYTYCWVYSEKLLLMDRGTVRNM